MSWNVARRDVLSHMATSDADLALLQEASASITQWPHELVSGSPDPWRTGGGPSRLWRTAVVRLSDRVALAGHKNGTLAIGPTEDDLCVSLDGSIAAADIVVDGEPLFTAVSVYAAWEKASDNRGYADASAHRILSDLSALITEQAHDLIIAGDWNLLYGYGEHGSGYWRDRYATVFDRARSLGLVMVGPSFPNGRLADPWPTELPEDSTCVPTFRHSRQTPATASRQLDFVFVSEALADKVSVRALNDPDEWGPSDHCRLLIDVDL